MTTMSLRKVAMWLGIIIAVCYAGSVGGTYHFDDSHSVQGNIHVRSLANIPHFWTDSRTSSFIPENRVYRPLVYTFYSFCWLIGGGETWPFHLMKMAMHLMVCLALFVIWRRLWSEPGWFPVKSLKIKFPFVSRALSLTPEGTAFFLAVIFAIHPTSSECVDYISATTSLQCAMFYLWAYVSYLAFRDTGNKAKLGLSILLYFLSVASKEEGITLPAMVLVTELFLIRGKSGEKISGGIMKMLPYALVGGVLAVWIYAMHPSEGNESRGFATPFEYFITQWRAYLWYMRLWFWPWDLNADNASLEFSHSLMEPLVIRAAIGNIIVLVFSWLTRKKYPAMLFGTLWFYITISPASSFVPLAEIINEHRMYLSYIGFIGGTLVVLLSWIEMLANAEERPKRLGWVTVLVVIGLLTGTQERNRVWANDDNLWADTVEKNPTSGRALNNLALVYLGRGDYAKAVDMLNRCEMYWSSYMYCALNKGIAYSALAGIATNQGKKDESDKMYGEAEKSLLRGYQLNPRSVHVNFHLGRYYEEHTKDFAKAIPYFKTAVDLTGGIYPEADLHLANCFSKLKQFDHAEESFARAVASEPGNPGLLFERARIEFENGNLDNAIASYEHLLQVSPQHLQGWYNYGVALLAQNQLPKARDAFEKTVQLDPRSEQGWYNLSFVGERQGDSKLALEAAEKLTSLYPGNGSYQARLHDLQKKYGS